MQATTTTTVQHRRAEQSDFDNTPSLTLQVADILFTPPVGHPFVVRVWMREGNEHDRREDGTTPRFVVECDKLATYAEDMAEARRVVRDTIAVRLRSFLEMEYGNGLGDE